MWGAAARPATATTAWGARAIIAGTTLDVPADRRSIDKTTSTPRLRNLLITKLGEGIAERWISRVQHLLDTREMTVASAGRWLLVEHDVVAVAAGKNEHSQYLDVCAFLSDARADLVGTGARSESAAAPAGGAH